MGDFIMSNRFDTIMQSKLIFLILFIIFSTEADKARRSTIKSIFRPKNLDEHLENESESSKESDEEVIARPSTAAGRFIYANHDISSK